MKKILVLLPDGVGLRNFIYTDFLKIADDADVVLWSAMDNLEIDGVSVMPLPDRGRSIVAEAKKLALIQAEIKHHAHTFSDEAYYGYLFPDKNDNIGQWVKNRLRNFYARGADKSQENLCRLRRQYVASLKKTSYYASCCKVLAKEKPDFVFCTHQRTLVAAVPLLAAQSLGIKTGTFIFSWDNLPKGNLAVQADHYFVWSDYMATEMRKYYPWISDKQVHVVGTPQFIQYTDESLYESRKSFFETHGLDHGAKTICFSGDDKTTSPYDHEYLRHTAESVRRLNAKGETKYQIVFRRSPIDMSDRYDAVIEQYSDIIKIVAPKWETLAGANGWHAIVPTPADSQLLVNTVRHCDLVVNVGSTMAIDFGINAKPACFFRYHAGDAQVWDIHRIYTFIHFQTMDGLEPVYWVDGAQDMDHVFVDAIEDKEKRLPNALKWAQRVAMYPLADANRRLWRVIDQCC